MRRVSPKRARVMRRVTQLRREIVEERGPYCQVCGQFRPLHCHEIARGVDRKKALGARCAILTVCGRCNTGPLNDAAIWPKPRQLALLWLTAPLDYDLEQFNRIVSPARIFQADVDHWIPLLRKDHYGDLCYKRASG